MAFIVALALAIFVLDPPLSYLAVAGGALIEIAESGTMLWWSRRRRERVGVQTLVGLQAVVVASCRPEGQVRVNGEIWRARCDEGADVGEDVRVEAVDGRELIVDVV